jgi:hypothetical protein
MGDKNDPLVSAVCTTDISHFISPEAAVSVIPPFIIVTAFHRRKSPTLQMKTADFYPPLTMGPIYPTA